MDKFFDIIKKLRPGVQSGKVSREQALAELMQESGVSEEIAGSAVTKMMPSSGGITTLPEAEVLDVSFKPGMDKRGKRVEESPSQASGAKEKTSWKDYVEEDTPSQGSGFANIDPDILSLGQKDRFEYEMAKYKQERSKRMQPFYKKYGAQSEKDKELVDELYEYNLEGEFVPSKGNPKYINNSARTFMQESVEDIPGVDEDLVLDILYSKESERFLKNQGVDNYINYVQTKFKEIGLNFNKPLLKRFLKDRYGPEEFSVGGRAGFKDGNEMPVVTINDKIDELISFYQDYLKQGGKMDFMTFAKKYIPENFAKGGRAGFAGGSDMGTVADSKGKTGPSKGGYQGGGTGPVERPSGGGGGNNNDTTYDYTVPKQIVKQTAINTVKNLGRRELMNTLGLAKFSNPIGIAMALKNFYDQTQNPTLTEEEAMGGGITGMDISTLQSSPYENMAPQFMATGGRAGFKDGVGRKGILSALKNKLNEIAPGSTAVGKATKAVSDKAKRAEVERELTQDFNRFNKKFPAEGDSFKDRQARLINDYPILKDETKLQQAVDDIYPSGDYKYDAEMAADALVENNPDIFNNLLREDLPEELSSEIYGAVLRPITNNMAKQMQLKKATRPEKTLASIKEGKGINISDPEIADEFGRFMKETDPEGYKELEQKVELSNFDTKGRKKNARGGLNYLMGL